MQIEQYLIYLSETYPKAVKLTTIGKTIEKRNIYVIEVEGTKIDGYKTNILVEGGMHGREKVTVSSALYALSQLVEHSEENQSLLKGLAWYIIPVLNPDGYVYAMEKVYPFPYFTVEKI